MSLISVSRVAERSPEALAREMYPQGFWDDQDFHRTYGNLIGLLRHRTGFEVRHPKQSEGAYHRQVAALNLAIESVYEMLCARFYKWACWPQTELRKPEAQGKVWYFLSAHIDFPSTEPKHEHKFVRRYGNPEVAYWDCSGFRAGETLAVSVESDDMPVRVGVSTERGLKKTWRGWEDEYVGPADGLMAWARSHGLLAYRLDLTATNKHPWSTN